MLYEGFEALTAVGVAVSGLRGCVAVRAGFPLALPPAGDACAPCEEEHDSREPAPALSTTTTSTIATTHLVGLGAGASVEVTYDAAVLSPKRAFIVAAKGPRAGPMDLN